MKEDFEKKRAIAIREYRMLRRIMLGKAPTVEQINRAYKIKKAFNL